MLNWLRKQIDHRNRLEMSHPIPQLHYLLLSSNLCYYCDVLQACTSDDISSTVRDHITEVEQGAANLAFRQFFEKAITSALLQMWDHINKTFRGAYYKARNENKKQH
ncbi:MAG: hypothetical protein SGPRY_001013 [Prymnesium sp.]